jgi:hypothetical protein
MKSRLLVILCIEVLLTLSLVAGGLRGNSQGTAAHSGPEVDFRNFPIVDLDSPEPSDASLRTRRANKSKKYNKKSQPKISELTDVTFVINEELGKLPALPVERSSVILAGEIVSAKAYLSEDKSSVYSEFEVRIETIFKNKSKQVLSPRDLIVIERFGGRVRLPSGKLFKSAVDNQDMPRVGSRYVLFLTNDFFGTTHSDEDFNLLIGYELKGGKVFPLDRVSTKHPIYRYLNVDESKLIADLSSALTEVRSVPN